MSIRILIVDDAPFMRHQLGKLFAERGWTVVGEAGDGRQALTQYQALRPDIVTMDITMPEVDGIAAVHSIMKADPSARIVMCSALGQQDRIVEAIRGGAKDFIVKPFQKERVYQAIEKAVGKAA